MRQARILIIEDDQALLRGLTDAFIKTGFQVASAQEGARGLELALDSSYDLLLLDIMLPQVNGFEICRAVREAGRDVAILILSAKGQEDDIVLGLNLGADDYVTKPFRVRELLARVQAFLRRRGLVSGEGRRRFGPFELDSVAHRLFREGQEVLLTAKEFRLLDYFTAHSGRALTRTTLLDAAWGRDLFVSERSVDRCVTTLRQKIEENPHQPRFIQTLREIGYRFED